MSADQLDDFAQEMLRNYAKKLRTMFELHLKAAEQSGATPEVEEIKQQLKKSNKRSLSVIRLSLQQLLP